MIYRSEFVESMPIQPNVIGRSATFRPQADPVPVPADTPYVKPPTPWDKEQERVDEFRKQENDNE